MSVYYRVYFKCLCGTEDVQVMVSTELTKASNVCECGKNRQWHRLVLTKQHEEKKGKTLNFIPPMHSYVELGMKGGPKEIHSRKTLEHYAKENGKVLASEKEIHQEADHQKRRGDEEIRSNAKKNVMERIAQIDYLRSQQR